MFDPELDKFATDMGGGNFTTVPRVAREYVIPYYVPVEYECGDEPEDGVEVELHVGEEPEEGVEVELVSCPDSWFQP